VRPGRKRPLTPPRRAVRLPHGRGDTPRRPAHERVRS
jgi:hypothetical protein